jgi:hypothetical protein
MSSYLVLIKHAIAIMKEENGTGKASAIAIKRHLVESNQVEELNSLAFKQALVKGVVSGELKKVKASYKLGTKATVLKKTKTKTTVGKTKKVSSTRAKKVTTTKITAKKVGAKRGTATKVTAKKKVVVPPSKRITNENDPEWRYPPCKIGGNHGMCASCCRAGFTKQGYIDYFHANPRKALPRPPERRSAPIA